MPEVFLGRARNIHDVVNALAGSRLVTIHGEPGMGKHAVAVAAARYVHERGLFAAGVHAIDTEQAERWNLDALAAPHRPNDKLLLVVKGLPSREALERPP